MLRLFPISSTRCMLLIVACLLWSTFLPGCGNSSQTAPSSQKTFARGSISLTVYWPKPLTRLIPSATDHIDVAVTYHNQTLAQQSVVRPSDGSSSVALFHDIVADAVTITATAFPKTELSQTALARGSVVVTVNPNASTQASLSLDSTVHQLTLTATNAALQPGATLPISIGAHDNGGAIVLLQDTNVVWSSDNPTVATVTTSGTTATLTGVSAGTAHITATETESRLTASLTVTVTSAQINYSDFQNVASLQLNGNSSALSGRLRVVSAGYFLSGSVWSHDLVPVNKGFDTNFAFQITSPSLIPGDGIVFVIQNAALNALGSSGEGIGYGQTYSAAIPNSLAIEFDDYANDSQHDPLANHISIHTRGTNLNSEDENYSLGRTTSVPNFADGLVHIARISYIPGTLSVFLDDMQTPLLSVPYTFEQGGNYLSGGTSGGLTLDQGRAWVGFTAATGNAAANYDVLNWVYTGTP